MTQEYVCRPIGTVVSSFKERSSPPFTERDTDLISKIIIDPTYIQGLEGLSAGKEMFVLCWFDRSDRSVLRVHPRGDRKNPLTGVFNTRSPDRPNPVSLTPVTLEEIQENILTVRGLDALDNTPVIDIKPCSTKSLEEKYPCGTET
ncbi:tRNA (N6-threonylcarbamoyladenosine(37)-N6)-methyltransferase TrmO [Methanocorpusculum sp. GPch4]|uniref:tRNA (N6-threonylcarbamoyladenosine(37)-N6)-methyltransferase TrmO n=1 Tax=Methanocorpusculum sp. GPch4 TaxID=2527877 RepID=UPI0014329E4C|nr:tRNA (N6-threonylcarbamoyladenosine(37)-N6)-methyltransferase TrmO [Methanocorpusculum sp. GPch4]